jgi:uncharacterized membrane protein
MKRLVPLMLAALVAAVAGHLVTVGLIPRVIMGVALERIAERSGGWNKLAHQPRVTAQRQDVVRSSPDLAYSTCALDLSRGPVRFGFARDPAGSYASVAVYAGNTDTVFVRNDREMQAEGLKLLIVGPRSPVAARPGEVTVSVPSDRALVLVRRLAPDEGAFARTETFRREDSCMAVKS